MSRPKAKYFLYYPAVLIFAALLLWIMPTDLVTGIASGMAAVIGCLMMWEFLFVNQVLRFTNIGAMGLVIGYGAGTLNSWLTLSRGSAPLAAVIGQTVPELANGVAAALAGCAVLLLVGELLETPILTMAEGITITTGAKQMLLANFAVIAAGVVAGKFHQGGIVAASSSHAGFVGIFLGFLVGATVVLVTIAFLVEQDKRQKYLLGGMMAFLWILEMTQGRRQLVYPALITIGLVRYAGFRWGRLTLSRVALIGGGIAFLFVGVLGYQILRIAGNFVPGHAHNIAAEARQVERWEAEGQAWKIATQSSVQNLKGRTLIVTFLSSILYEERTASPVLGEDLLYSVATEIPSILFPGKPAVSGEVIASVAFHRFYPDEPDSLFTAGALDFGMVGLLVYPIMMLLMLSTFLRLLAPYLASEVFLFGVVLCVANALAAEETLAAYFGTMRNFLIFAGFFYVASRMPVFRWKSTEY